MLFYSVPLLKNVLLHTNVKAYNHIEYLTVIVLVIITMILMYNIHNVRLHYKIYIN